MQRQRIRTEAQVFPLSLATSINILKWMESTGRGDLPSHYSNSALFIFSKLMLRTMEINPSRATIAMILFKQFLWPVSASCLTITELGGARGAGGHRGHCLKQPPVLPVLDLNNQVTFKARVRHCWNPKSGVASRRQRLARHVWRQFQIDPFVRSIVLFFLLMTRGSLSLSLFITAIHKNIRRCPVAPGSTPLGN